MLDVWLCLSAKCIAKKFPFHANASFTFCNKLRNLQFSLQKPAMFYLLDMKNVLLQIVNWKVLAIFLLVYAKRNFHKHFYWATWKIKIGRIFYFKLFVCVTASTQAPQVANWLLTQSTHQNMGKPFKGQSLFNFFCLYFFRDSRAHSYEG